MNSPRRYTLLLIVFSFVLLSNKCEKKEDSPVTETITETTDMEEKIVYTFNGSYIDLWKKVDSLENIGLYQSALDVVDVIFTAAQKDQNSPEVVKAIIHKMKFSSYIKEDDYVIALNELSSLAQKEEFPLKQLVHSVTAEVYSRYYSQNRWKFINRSTTVNFENNDIRTWDLTHINNEINRHYFLSLTEKDKLQRVDITDFSEILMYSENSIELQPTLFDFLANRALAHFSNSETSLIRPADKFVIEGKDYFGSNTVFLSVNTTSNDSLSNYLHAVKIYKELTQFHLNDKDPSAQIDLELRRLQFAYTHITDEAKGEWYIAALDKLAEKHANHSSSTKINYKRGLYYQERGNTYSTSNAEVRWELKKAIELCDESMKKYPESFGAQQCKSLKHNILSKSIDFTAASAYLPNKKGKLLVSYKNVDSLYFRVFKANWDAFTNTNLYGEELMDAMLKYDPVHEWSVELENPKDYQNHTTEILLPENELGHYFILASAYSDFRLVKNNIVYSSFWSTNLGFTQRNNSDGSLSVAVSDRSTGKPLKNVKATVLLQKYNYTSRRYEVKAQESYNSDDKGMFTVAAKKESRSIYLELKNGNDVYNNGSQLYQYYRREQPKNDYLTTHFFTDRGIYRPGQTIHFKGIKLKHTGESHQIATNHTSTVTLYDVNHQKIADLQLTTNEYGTFSGTFTAPMGVLNGRMTLQDAHGSHSFLVEEYKRPKFEVAFTPVKESYKLGQNIKVEGNAKAYAGSVIDGAKVSYRVTRSSYFPSWVYYRWGYYPQGGSNVEITNGEVTTDETGKFTIHFDAKSDASIPAKYMPNYSYTVTADVTDINGETRSSSQVVTVGTTAMNLSLYIPAKIDKSDTHNYPVSTSNLNGQKVGAKGKVVITKLIEPDRVYRAPLWQQPDMKRFSQTEFNQLFENDQYDKEADVTQLKKGEQVLSKTFDTSKEDSISLKGFSSWTTGRYIIETTALDTFGVEVREVQYITLIDKKSDTAPTKELWTATALKSYCEPGEVAQFLIASAAKDVSVLYEIERKGKVVHSEIIQLNGSQKLISLPIKEEDRGNVTVHFSTVKFERSFSETFTVYVPFSNKQLDVTFETFRDKLLPGSKEEWRIRIKGPKGEKVAAEMLVAMYDASLDVFAGNSFGLYPYTSNYSYGGRSSSCFSISYSQRYGPYWNDYHSLPHLQYPSLNWFGFENYYNYNYYGYERGGAYSLDMDDSEIMMDATISKRQKNMESPSPVAGFAAEELKESEEDNRQESAGEMQQGFDGKDKSKGELGSVQVRTNLNETAFFYPHLSTDANGDVLIKFTMPEALTKWKFIGLAHTKDLKIGSIQEEVVTQKELMVQPNAPRFMREGDQMTFSAKVSNLSEEDLDGTAQLFLFDAVSMQPIDHLFNNASTPIDFSVKKGQSAPLMWNISVPEGVGAVTYRVVAQAKNHTDGEEMAVPILSNRMLVTESLPLPSKGIGTKTFSFLKLLESGNSTSIKHHKVTLEYTSNPAWYAVQAIPYMMEYPHECAEQTFTRYYSNAIASNIVNSSPKIKQVFESWKSSSPDAFLSNLQKNQELKSVMLEETPWVLDAKSESERKKRVALLFDLNKMDNELAATIRKLEKMQVSNGGFPWFPGMPESRYITQHIMTGMGHLDNLGVKNVREDKSVWKMVTKGINYLDQRLVEDYNWVKKHAPNYLNEQHIGEYQVQYLYARSYFKDIPMDKNTKEAFDYYQQQAATYWTKFSIYSEGMIALQAKRYDNSTLAVAIMKSLKERALVDDELGMYWKANAAGYYWYQAPIETQALLIEAFDEVTDDQTTVEELKVWLLKQKQTTDWKTTKATAEACYALLLKGTSILENDELVEIRIGGKLLDPTSLGTPVEAGTGYFKTSWSGSDITPNLGNISVTRKTKGVSWGAMYWQYFEDLDKITTHDTKLKLDKKLFIVKNTAGGPVISPISSTTKLKVGDKVRVRIELRTDRNMEYVHMKDMRAAGFEPVNVISRYKWQDGLGYYESTRDAATHFFFDYLPKGTYVFEYDIRVSHVGQFSNGIATIQCMYAPEFTSHSEGIKVSVE